MQNKSRSPSSGFSRGAASLRMNDGINRPSHESSSSPLSSVLTSSPRLSDNSVWYPTSSAVGSSRRKASKTVVSIAHPPRVEKALRPSIEQNTGKKDNEISSKTTCDVQRTVYYFADSLEQILSSPHTFSFRSDPLRMTMIVKWMRFYRYYPGWDKAIDKARRGELKIHLKLPPRFGQKLGSILVNKFNSFAKAGLVSRPTNERQHANYSSATDVWLSPTWDWNTESAQQHLHADDQPISSPHMNLEKPSVSRESLTEGKLQNPNPHTPQYPTSTAVSGISGNATITVDTLSSLQNPHLHESSDTQHDVWAIFPRSGENLFSSSTVQTSSCTRCNDPISGCAFKDDNISGRALDTAIRQTVPPPTTVSEPTRLLSSASLAQNKVASNAHFQPAINDKSDQNNLPKRLEQLQSSKIYAIPNLADSATRRKCGELGPLKENEKFYVKGLNETIEALKAARTSHTQLCQQYESLKSDGEAIVKLLETATSRRQAVSRLTPAEPSDAEVALSMDAICQSHASLNQLRHKEEEKLKLFRKITQQAEIKSGLETCIAAKKARLKQIQEEIKGVMKRKAKVVARKRKWEAFVNGFENVDDNSDSGSFSPVECLPDSLAFEEEDDEDDDEESLNGASLLMN